MSVSQIRILGGSMCYIQAYSLKVKEIEDQMDCSLYDYSDNYFDGNIEYRIFLRCKQMSRKKYFSMREDVLTKLDLVDDRHGQTHVDYFLGKNMNLHFRRLVAVLHDWHSSLHSIADSSLSSTFPIPIDVSKSYLTLN
ncbi:PRKCA-binding protein-like [Octopus sinensis]|uniref:PRKCA-binding protein-like n=1 Tax=Octopus sinensis TaxID=2607531 RepID=A0A6P7U119_9MOLL|nr:PRKCA-binding protein-like [Octopus sinensis]